MSHVPIHAVRFGNSTLPFSLQRSPKRTTVEVSVGKQNGIEVVAPEALEFEEVARIVRRKGPWIRQQLRDLELIDDPPAQREWKEGESLQYLGRNYRLRYTAKEADKVQVRLKDGFFIVSCPPGAQESEAVGEALESWYRSHARWRFEERVPLFAKRLGLPVPPLRLRKQAERWGSCTSKGEILLNWQLVAAPPSVIDYVLAHECVHLVERGHNQTFYALLRKLMPDYRLREERLKREGAGYVMFQ